MNAGTPPPPADPIRPLYDVWLRPRRVFRALAGTPVGATDYLLGAAQGIVSWLMLSRGESAAASQSLSEILMKAFIVGSFAGVASLWVMGSLYAWLGKRVGGVSNRTRVIHVMAYGGVPMAASLVLWVLAALLLGESVFQAKPSADTDTFVFLLIRVLTVAHAVLVGWTFLLQVMGFSEVERLTTRRAFGTWLIGQLIALVVMAMLTVLLIGAAGQAPQT